MLLKVTIGLLAVWAVHTQLRRFRKKWCNILLSQFLNLLCLQRMWVWLFLLQGEQAIHSF